MIDRLARRLLAWRIRRSFYTWSAARLQRHQQARLAAVTAYAAEHAPYYRALRAQGWDGRFESLPYLSKTEMLAHYEGLNTAGLAPGALFEFALAQQRNGGGALYQGRYSVGLSSGTSGTRLPTVLSASERWQYGSLLFARSGIPDSLRQPRVLFALRVNNPAFMEARFLGVEMVYVDYNHPAEALVRLANERRLNVLAGPPSLLRLLARQVAQFDHPIQALVSYAEVLDDATRVLLQSVFQAPLAQIYQGAEGFIASTCRRGSLHINEDVVYLEALEAGDTLGDARRVVVTDLYRRTLPFLRYQMNDLLEFDPTPCPCGSVFRRVRRIHGRADDIFYLRRPDGSLANLFPDYVVRAINQAGDAAGRQVVLEFQALQHSPERIEIRMALAPGADLALLQEQIRANLAHWAAQVGAAPGEVFFSSEAPARNPTSLKLIRVSRLYD